MRPHPPRLMLLVSIALAGLLVQACTKESQKPAAPPPAAAPAAASRPTTTPHEFRGKVEKNDPATKSLTVAAEDVKGWMDAMTMIMLVDNDAVRETLKPGDQITATVYDGDFKTLYDVKVVAPAPK